MAPVAWSEVACRATLGLQAAPYGDRASAAASVMNGFGMISTGGPPAPSRANAIEPSGRWYGISPPPVLITNGRDASDAAAAAEASVIRSFRAVGVPWDDTSPPGATPA